MYELIQEGQAKVYVPKEKKISKKLPVFYNPKMGFNRSVSVLILNEIKNKDMKICLPLAGSGVRGIRFLKELKKGKIKEIYFNDNNEKAAELIKKNLSLNKVKNKFYIHNQDANEFLAENKGFDYIDIDPFGTPNPFLDLSIKALSRRGILAVTATDTSALAGTYPDACMRKYWAKPLRSELMHEIGVRILIRKVQLIGAQYEKTLTPIYSYSTEHYYRIFFKCEKGKKKADKILKEHGNFKEAGPMWLGQLWDKSLAQKLGKQDNKLLKIIAEEAKIDTVGFYDIHAYAKRLKITIPKTEELIKRIKKKKHKAALTHFREVSLRSTIKEKEFVKVLK